ncbi:spore germination protein GerW family protein [Georgenia faecalis]|uniref:Spore germination protein GerW family protein n=1 Tax=Georgenia faecalis TaxID=2483799 RepID=A0ABV9DE74_9MICO|nr:spore germination protein GerW family protein [Georgenia faecalis]
MTETQRTPAGDANLPVDSARKAMSVRRVFGEAYQADGATIIPVAKVMGFSGMGFGGGALGTPSTEPASEPAGGEGSGGGGGFAVRTRPLGVYVVRGDRVRWQPSIDVNRAIIGGQAVGAIAVVSLSWALRRRRR